MAYTFGSREGWKTKSPKTSKGGLIVFEGIRGLRAASPELKEASGRKGAGSEIYCVAIGRIGKEPPPRFGYPGAIGMRPKFVVCLCLTPVRQAEGAEPDTAYGNHQ
ncbi:hypothetical protein F5B21DRAFT_506457 [Xylaria acuta]|nr:hypothetical protein F5B21DRAFT_506457 [Xylaria acuta]